MTRARTVNRLPFTNTSSERRGRGRGTGSSGPAAPRPRGLLGLAGVCASAALLGAGAPSRADDRFWLFQGDPTFETYFNGAFAGPPYWYGFNIPGATDTVYFGQGSNSPPPPASNPLGRSPSTVYFGNFNHQSFISGLSTSYSAINATIDRAILRSGEWTFDFGSGVGGWAPLPPAPAYGSLTAHYEVFVAPDDGNTTTLNVRNGVLTNQGVGHIASGNASTGLVDISGPTAEWDVGAWLDLGWVGDGTVRVSNSGRFHVVNNVYAGIRNSSVGHLIVSSSGSARIDQALSLGAGGESTGGARGTLLVESQGTVFAHDVYVGATGSGQATVSGGAALAVQQLLRIAAGSGPANLTVDNGVAIGADIRIGDFGQNNAVTVTNSGVLWAGNLFYVGQGAVTVSNGGKIISDLGFDLQPGGSIDLHNNGEGRIGPSTVSMVPGWLVIGQGQTLTAEGLVRGGVLAQGTLSPGHGIGLFTIDGPLSISAGGRLLMDVGGINPGSQHDRVNVSGTLTLGGTLQVSAASGFSPGANDVITLISAGSISGRFASVSLPPSWGMEVVYTPTSVTLKRCYANCDGSTTSPILNVNDFSCFMTRYAANDPYANCDGSTTTPVLNVNDFICFLSKYAAGCP